MKNFMYILILIVFAGCKTNKVEISGTLIKPDTEKYIYLDELKSNELTTVDSVKIAADGKFGFKLEIKMPSFYMLKINENNFLTMLVNPGENIKINSHFDSLNYPVTVTGSKGTELMAEYNRTLRKNN